VEFATLPDDASEDWNEEGVLEKEWALLRMKAIQRSLREVPLGDSSCKYDEFVLLSSLGMVVSVETDWFPAIFLVWVNLGIEQG